jgi:hypothetical protein
MELLEEIRIDIEEIQRGWIGKTDDLHVAKKQKQIVQFAGLPFELALVAPIRHAMEKVADVLAERHDYSSTR